MTVMFVMAVMTLPDRWVRTATLAVQTARARQVEDQVVATVCVKWPMVKIAAIARLTVRASGMARSPVGTAVAATHHVRIRGALLA